MNLLNWKPENQELNSDNFNMIVAETPIEIKIAIVDKFNDGKLTKALKVHEAFEAQKDSIKKDSWGSCKTNSLRAWLKKNDPDGIFDIRFYVGRINLAGVERWIGDLNRKGGFGKYESFIDESFYRTLYKMLGDEKKWFREHDEYSVAMDRVKKLIQNSSTTFGLRIIYNSEWIKLHTKDDIERFFTLEELKKLENLYKKLDNFVNELSKEVENF